MSQSSISGQIHLERSGAIATIILDRPEKLHALTPDMLDRLGAIVRHIDQDTETRAVIVTSTGDRAFCSGADIAAWSALEPIDMWRRWVRGGHRILDELARLRQPTIAAIGGLAFGGGLELALACDLRLASTTATFASPETSVGTVPGWGGTARLTTAIGAARAKWLVLSGRRIDATTALTWGLVEAVVPADELMSTAMGLAADIAGNAPVAVQLAKQLIDASGDVDRAATLEAIAGALAATTEDATEGVAAFREKRRPTYTGR